MVNQPRSDPPSPLFVLVPAAGLLLALLVLHFLASSSRPAGEEGDREPVRSWTAPQRLRYALPGGVRVQVVASPLTGHCGIELWPIKTLTDQLAGAVSLTPKRATIRGLASLPAPPDRRGRSRVGLEEQTWRIRAKLTGYRLEADSDLHLVLESAGRTMIAEIPDPACAPRSRVLAAIATARASFLSKHDPSRECLNCLSVPVTVDGVGFFDKLHGQAGVAANGIELHPVTAYREG